MKNRPPKPPEPKPPEIEASKRFRERVHALANAMATEHLCPVSVTYETENERGMAFRKLAEKLGPRYCECTLDNFFPPDISASVAAESLKAFAGDMPKQLRDGGGVTLFGKPGTGKDHLLAALMFEAILEHGFHVEWVNGLDLYAEMRRRIQDDASEEELIRRYQKPLILVISDPLPPKGDTSDYQASTLYRIIDRRYRDMKSTWATMNVEGGEEANTRIAQNVIDRLRHNSICIHCSWSSYRKAKD